MRSSPASLAAAVLLLTVASARAEPVKVAIGMHVVDLRNVDVRSQSFSADFYVWLRFPAEGLDEARLNAVMALEPVNGRFESKELIDDKLVGAEKYVSYRVNGTFFFVPDLKKYPFDRQTLPITLESTSLEVDEVVFVDDRASYERSGTPEARWGLSPTLFVPDYRFEGVQRRVFEGSYPTNFGDPTKLKAGTRYSRFALETSFEREYWSYAFKILVPLLIILAMAYLVFFLPADQLDTAASVAMTALLSCMAYNVAVTQNMPEIGYLVLSDKFFIATYVLLLVTLAQVFLVFKLDAAGKQAEAARLDRLARVAFPLLVTGIFGFFVASV
jgi:hypothetical protein